jgi:tRNA pseudouridine38-40 synthase
MPAYLLDLAIDGDRYHGTQIQGNGLRTVQGELTTAVRDLTEPDAQVRMASRLDQGVCARSLPAVCRCAKTWDPAVLGLALNQRLGTDAVIQRVAPVVDDFDPLREACVKTYRYTVRNQPVRPVLDRRSWWIRDLDLPERFAELAALIPGRHDLSGFSCLRHDNTDDQDPVREYQSAAWSTGSDDIGPWYRFHICGRGFLYKQIRGIVGAMVHIVQGRATVSDFAAAMAAGRAAQRLGNIAPAEGLLLESVNFDREPEWVTVKVGNKAPV